MSLFYIERSDIEGANAAASTSTPIVISASQTTSRDSCMSARTTRVLLIRIVLGLSRPCAPYEQHLDTAQKNFRSRNDNSRDTEIGGHQACLKVKLAILGEEDS